jgi:hypothetical protein
MLRTRTPRVCMFWQCLIRKMRIDQYRWNLARNSASTCIYIRTRPFLT